MIEDNFIRSNYAVNKNGPSLKCSEMPPFSACFSLRQLMPSFASTMAGSLTAGLNTYIHEKAHALMMQILCKDVHPTVTIDHWLWGNGRVHANGDCKINTFIGSLFSLKTINGLVAAAGPAADALNVMGSIAAALALRNKYRLLSLFLSGHAFVRADIMMNYYHVSPGTDPHDYYLMAENLSIPHNLLSFSVKIVAAAATVNLIYQVGRECNRILKGFTGKTLIEIFTK